MKTSIFGIALTLAIASFGFAAYANVNESNTRDCQSISPASPTGGGTRERMAAIKLCNEIRSEQQAPSTLPTKQPNPPSEVPSPTQ